MGSQQELINNITLSVPKPQSDGGQAPGSLCSVVAERGKTAGSGAPHWTEGRAGLPSALKR